MIIPLLAVSAVVPSALLVWYFHTRDVYPEPPRVLWTTFGLGMLTVIPVLAVGFPLQEAASRVSDAVMASILSALFVAAIPEEFVKLTVLVGYNLRHKAFDEPMDGIVYGVVASLGFATLENVLFVFDGGLTVAASRAFSAVPLHAFVGAIMGYYVGQAHFHPAKRTRLILKGYGIAVTLHALYDFPLMAMGEVEDAGLALVLALLTLLVLVVCWRWTVRLVRKLHKEQRASFAMTQARENLSDTPVTPLPFRKQLIPRIVAIVGGIVASFGGMITFGLILAFLIGAVQEAHTIDIVIGGVIIGLIPLAGGLILFRRGVRGMNRKASVPPPMAQAPA